MWKIQGKTLQLHILSAVTLVAVVNVIYVLVRVQDPFYPYLLGAIIGEVPYVPYFWGCLSIAVLCGSWTLFSFQRANHAVLSERMGRGHRVVINENQHIVLDSMQQVLEELAGQQERYEFLFQTLTDEVVQVRGDLGRVLQNISPREQSRPQHPLDRGDPITPDSDPTLLKGIGPKTRKALQTIGITSVATFLTSDPTIIAANTYLSLHQVQHLQATAQMLLAPQLTYEDALLVTN